jgi:hypothetical protein
MRRRDLKYIERFLQRKGCEYFLGWSNAARGLWLNLRLISIRTHLNFGFEYRILAQLSRYCFENAVLEPACVKRACMGEDKPEQFIDEDINRPEGGGGDGGGANVGEDHVRSASTRERWGCSERLDGHCTTATKEKHSRAKERAG